MVSAQATDPPARAQRLLAAGDLDGYRELFGLLEQIDDRNRRYQAGVSLVEQGLAASSEPAGLPALYATLAEGLVGMLEPEPREPRLLNYAGVVFYELWSLDAATALFEAAGRLDPRLGQLDRNLAALAARRQKLRFMRRRSPLRDLGERAIALAARARPVEGLRLSLCMIVRDEEQMLPRCLEAVRDAVDEIVVVDTGSRDRTVEIARSFGARVLRREWTGSFAEARNASFDAAGGDWLMYLDADEVLAREDAGLLRSLTGRVWREAFYVSETSHTGAAGDGTAVTHDALRIFRNRPEYRFEGRLHEQIAHSLPTHLPERFEATAVRVEHFGYLAAVREARGKTARNIELLRLQQAEEPPTAFLHYNLGSELAAAGDAPAALAELERAWTLLAPQADLTANEFAPALICRLVETLRACDRPADALARAREGLARFPGLTDLVLEQAIASAALGDREGAIELFERCLRMGDAPGRYAATVGCGSYLAMVQLAALRRDRGELAQAIELLERCLREHPRYLGSLLPYIAAQLASGMPPQAVSAELDRLMPAPTHPPARLLALLEDLLQRREFEAFEAMLGLWERTSLPVRERRELLAELYFRSGYAASAAEEWMTVCREAPDAQALLGLARVAMAKGMTHEAGELAAAALAHDPHDRAAARLLSELRRAAA